MQALDAVNERYGRGTLRLGSTRVQTKTDTTQGHWQMKQERRTPRYTTRWGEMFVV